MNNNALPERVFGLPPERGRWGFLLLGLLVNLCLGAVYAYSVFKEPLRETLGLTATQGNLPFMAFIAVFSVGTAFSVRFLDRYGPRAVMMSGSVLVGIGRRPPRGPWPFTGPSPAAACWPPARSGPWRFAIPSAPPPA